MSSWAQQLEAIRRAAQGGVRARTNAQRSQRLPLANNRLREVLLSRPNGELTRAGQFYYGLVGGRSSTRSSPSSARGPRTTSCSARELVRSLQPDGSYSTTSPHHSHPPGGGLWGTDCPFLLPEPGNCRDGRRPETSCALVARRGASPKNAGCRRRRARPSRAA